MNSRLPNPFVRTILLFIFVGLAAAGNAQSLITLQDRDQLRSIGYNVTVLNDSRYLYTDSSILLATGFKPVHRDIPVFPEAKINNWIRFSVSNQTGSPTLYLMAQTPAIPAMDVYRLQAGKLNKIYQGGSRYPYADRQEDDVNYILDLHILSGDTATYYLHINSDHHLVLPLLVGTRVAVGSSSDANLIIIGAYFGILLVIFFYNLFIYFSVNDRNYLIYIIYVFFLGIAQLTSSGFAFKYFWADYPYLNHYMVVLTSSIVCMMAIVFAVYSLQIRKYAPKLMWVAAYFLITYTVSIVANFYGDNYLSYNILDINGILMAVFVISTSIYTARKGFKAAYFYGVAWFLYMLGVIGYVLKNYGILPSNQFTNYAIYIGSSLEAILLSIALADTINVLKREKQASQNQALEVSRENERLVRERNIDLEAKVHERTVELENTNTNLNNTLEHLKATQSQLVEAEKMASLGVLTAGIAHEINNPINFVKSNIKPLQLDIQDLWEVIQQYEKVEIGGDIADQLGRINAYKRKIDIGYIRDEISSLLQGIEDGASRTAEIVKGLRTFSRLDETELKKVNLYEGLDSTLVLLRSSMPVNVQVIRNYEVVPAIDCFPGKLNQVFMNIMGNAMYAMDKKHSGQTEYLTVDTYLYDQDHVAVRIADTGTGMPDSVKEKIFDPFFTTKEIGEGTGLGLSIVFSIIEKHKGKIIVHSTLGKGTEFLIVLPIVHPII